MSSNIAFSNFFESTSIELIDDSVVATRAQVEELYEVPKRTLADAIKRLKRDGLVSGAKIRHTASDGKKYQTEVFDLDEIISIGMRLRSDRAIMFQKWAREVIKNKLKETIDKLKTQQLLAERAWDQQDRLDLIPKWR